MQTLDSQILLQTLQQETNELLAFARHLPTGTQNILIQSPASGGWSIAQVLEHLNTYCDYYLPLLGKALQQSPSTTSMQFHPGWLGDYFTKLIQPAPAGAVQKKMKAAKKHLPSLQPNTETVVKTFIAHQEQLLIVLQQAAGKNMHSIKIPVSILPVLKLKTGDIFRFLCAHQQRHLKQMQLILAEVYQPSITYS